MNAPQTGPGQDRAPALLSPTHQRVIATITLISMLLMGGHWTREYVLRGRLIDIERPYLVDNPSLRIDLNQAAWPELTLLPGISETMARRIVEFRQANGRFRSTDEVQRVKGIGPRTYARVAPYLVTPLSSSAATLPRN